MSVAHSRALVAVTDGCTALEDLKTPLGLGRMKGTIDDRCIRGVIGTASGTGTSMMVA